MSFYYLTPEPGRWHHANVQPYGRHALDLRGYERQASADVHIRARLIEEAGYGVAVGVGVGCPAPGVADPAGGVGVAPEGAPGVKPGATCTWTVASVYASSSVNVSMAIEPII